MIPMSFEDKLETVIDGVKYFFHPPIDEIERVMQETARPNNEKKITETQKLLPKAKKLLDKSLKGKKQPNKSKYNELLENQVIALMEEAGITEEDIDSGIERSKKFIDTILCGWEWEDSKGKKPLPKFPEKPSKCIPQPLMNKLANFYWDQYIISEEDLKK